MFRFFLCISVLLAFAVTLLAQTDDRVPPEPEKGEVQRFAASFFNDLEKTGNIRPLLRRYFIADLPTRLKFCGRTGGCGGFGRDFWQRNENLAELGGSKADYTRDYINGINGFWLFIRSIVELARINGVEPEDFESDANKIIDQKLRKALGRRSYLIERTGIFDEDGPPRQYKTLAAYRRGQKDREVIIDAWRGLERELRVEAARRGSASRVRFVPADLRVYKEKSTTRFFDYSIGTWMYSVWPDEMTKSPFIADLVRINGRLRIIAIYPPID